MSNRRSPQFENTAYVAPTVLVGVNHCEFFVRFPLSRLLNQGIYSHGRHDGKLFPPTPFEWILTSLLKEETFGPVIGIQKVGSDEEAVKLMNDSPYGLTASIWTNVEKNPESQKEFLQLVDELETGTVFLNR